MGELANAITEEFRKKGIPLPNGAGHTRPGVQVIGAAKNGVVQDGGSVKVSPLAMDAAPEKRAEVKDGRVRIQDATLRDGRYMTTDAEEAAVRDSLAIKDAAYEEFLRGFNRSATEDRRSGPRPITLPSLPGYISRDHVPEIFAALRDAENSDDVATARVGIERLLAVARMCRERAKTAEGEEARQATASADYCEGLAHAAELVMCGKITKTADHRGTPEAVRDAAYQDYLDTLRGKGR